MTQFKNIGVALPWFAFLATSVAEPVAPQLKNAHIVEEHSSRERLKEVQKNLPQAKAPKGDKLKEAIVKYNSPRQEHETTKFKLRAVEFTPKSSLLSQERLDQLASKYLNRDITFNDVQRLRIDIINEYQQSGYILSTVNIPAQKLFNNTLTLELLESKIKRINFSGNEYLPDDYFDRHVGKYREEYFNVRDLERDLLRFNRTSKANMVAKSKASDEYGYSDLVFDVYEPDRWNIRFGSDNYGTRRTGDWRLHASLAAYDVSTGVDDNLVLGTTQAEGSNSWYGIYERPLNSRGTRASLTYTLGKTNVRSGSEEDLDIEGTSESLAIKIEHLLYCSQKASLHANIGYRYSDSESFFVGDFLDDTRSETAFIGLSADSTDDHGSWRGEMTLSAGNSRRFDEADQGYTTLQLYLERLHRLGDHWTAKAVMNGQISDDTRLPASESFFLGGQYTVRGFEEGTALGADGWNVNLELSTAPFQWFELAENHTLNNIALTLFVDHGTVYTDKGGGIGIDSDAFTSCGVSLLYEPIPALVLSLTYAKPIDIDHEFHREKNWTSSISYTLSF